MRRLTRDKRVAIAKALCEGCSVRSTSRLVGVSVDAILKFLLDLGRVCMYHEDEKLRSLYCARIEADEIWGFTHCKDRAVPHAKLRDDVMGSVWTWYAVDVKSKAILSWMMGDRDAGHAHAFMADLASRLAVRPELTTDALGLYANAVFDAFARLGVDYCTVHKDYGRFPEDGHHYSPPQCTGIKKASVFGSPRVERCGTSIIERANLTLRMTQRRWTRLTNAHSKSFAHMQAAFALHACYYNWCRKHGTIGTTPAVSLGIAEQPWTVADIVGLLEADERKAIGTEANRRGPYKPRRGPENCG